MTPRRDLARATYAADRAIDAMSRDLMGRVGKAVRQCEGPITQSARTAILRDVDDALDRWYPKRRGAPSRLQGLIEDHARRVTLLPIEAAVNEIERYVPELGGND